MLVGSKSSFIGITYSVKEQNKFCCLIISYSDNKLKWLNIACLFKKRNIENFENIPPGESINLHDINNNISFSQKYYQMYLFSSTSLLPSVACSNLMGGGVPAPRNGHRSVSLRHSTVFIKTRRLFKINL